jgi:hypothetical protein
MPLVGRVVVSNPSKTRAIAEAKVKTDPFTELRRELGQVGGRMGVWVSTVADRDYRRGCAAGSVPAGGAAARVA